MLHWHGGLWCLPQPCQAGVPQASVCWLPQPPHRATPAAAASACLKHCAAGCPGCLPGHDFLTVLGAHEGEGLLVEHDAAVRAHAIRLLVPPALPCRAGASAADCGCPPGVLCRSAGPTPAMPLHSCMACPSPLLPQVAGSRSADTKGQRADQRIVEVGWAWQSCCQLLLMLACKGRAAGATNTWQLPMDGTTLPSPLSACTCVAMPPPRSPAAVPCIAAAQAPLCFRHARRWLSSSNRRWRGRPACPHPPSRSCCSAATMPRCAGACCVVLGWVMWHWLAPKLAPDCMQGMPWGPFPRSPNRLSAPSTPCPRRSRQAGATACRRLAWLTLQRRRRSWKARWRAASRSPPLCCAPAWAPRLSRVG